VTVESSVANIYIYTRIYGPRWLCDGIHKCVGEELKGETVEWIG